MDFYDESPLLQLQKLMQLTLPALSAFVILRALGVLFLKFFAMTARRYSPFLSHFIKIANRLDRAGQIAGKTSCFLCLLIACWNITEIWDEVYTCKVASAPRPHSMFLTSAFINMLATAAFSSNFLSLVSFVVFARRSPLAYMVASMAFMEWATPRGAIFEFCMVAAYAASAHAASIHLTMCGQRFVSSDTLVMSVGGVGSVIWLSTLVFRTIVDGRLVRA
tara:strand:- start:280 stop:942 length:663 start_codon:yes stop_codon:yes gene_type:complete